MQVSANTGEGTEFGQGVNGHFVGFFCVHSEGQGTQQFFIERVGHFNDFLDCVLGGNFGLYRIFLEIWTSNSFLRPCFLR